MAEEPLKTTVLIADDNPDNVELVREVLEGAGYTVVTAYDGDEALLRVAESNPDLIILDVMMPGKDGFETLAQLRSEPATKDIPVVILTAKDLNQRERAALDGKIQALFQKGQVSLDQLITDVQNAITRHPAGV